MLGFNVAEDSNVVTMLLKVLTAMIITKDSCGSECCEVDMELSVKMTAQSGNRGMAVLASVRQGLGCNSKDRRVAQRPGHSIYVNPPY